MSRLEPAWNSLIEIPTWFEDQRVWLGLIAALAAGGLLWGFNRTVETRWPDAYSSMDNVLEAFVLRGVFRHVLFRVVPLYITLVFVAVVIDEASEQQTPVSVAIWLGAVIHAAQTNGRALRLIPRGRLRAEHVLYHGGMLVLLLGTAALVNLTYQRWEPLIPPLDEFNNVVWTAVLASVLGLIAQRLVTVPRPTTGQLLVAADADIGPKELARCRDAALRHDTDPELMHAVLAAEALQRPRWFRRAERAKGLVFKPGTYGVAQVHSDRPLSDGDSIERLCSSFAGFFPTRRTRWLALDRPRLASRIEAHNPDRAFAGLVMGIYEELVPSPVASSRALGRDGRPVIEVHRVRRRLNEWVVEGSTWCDDEELRIRQLLLDGQQTVMVLPLESYRGRRGWSISMSIDVDRFFVRPPSVGRGQLARHRAVVSPGEHVWD